jgi:hypothetical protein
MNAKLDRFESGWVGLEFALSPAEIDVLIERLNELKKGSVGHFHFRTDDFSLETGVADVHIALIGPSESHNMQIE